ncbi:MAG: NAD(P)-binding domain-containing protein [Anaerolineae bacterium]|nr:NAD(P)-binding domain-containing protein [Anaerolineae bacterium]
MTDIRIAFIGAGRMGFEMARRLAKGGAPVARKMRAGPQLTIMRLRPEEKWKEAPL